MSAGYTAKKITVRSCPCSWLYTAWGASLSYQDLGRRRTETTHQQRVGSYESLRYWRRYMLASGVSGFSRCRLCWRRTFWAHNDVTWHAWLFLRDNHCQWCLSLFS